jgi:hypothetical protein
VLATALPSLTHLTKCSVAVQHHARDGLQPAAAVGLICLLRQVPLCTSLRALHVSFYGDTAATQQSSGLVSAAAAQQAHRVHAELHQVCVDCCS